MNNNPYDPNGYYNGYNNGGGGFGGGMNNPASYVNNQPAVSLADYTKKVFGWMFVGLLITFGICLAIVNDPVRVMIFMENNIGLYYFLLLAEVVLVFVLGFFVSKIPPVACTAIFLAYSVLNGITIGPLLVLFDVMTAVFAFAVTAGIFGAMTLYGMITKRDLSSLGTVLVFGLFGLILFSVIAMFFNVPMMDLAICLVGIVIFVGFTAYDTQKIKRYYSAMQGDSVLLAKGAIIVALDLYLDFINLFLYILRILGARKN